MDDDFDLSDSMFLVSVDSEGKTRQTLSFSRTPTVLMNFAANRFTRSTARRYQSQFGIGAMDWRMLVMLTRAPGSSVSHAADVIGIDKGAVSRSLARLDVSGLAWANSSGSDPRRKQWYLTDAGHALHDEILVEALASQKKILKDFSRRDVEELNRLLGKILENMRD